MNGSIGIVVTPARLLGLLLVGVLSLLISILVFPGDLSYPVALSYATISVVGLMLFTKELFHPLNLAAPFLVFGLLDFWRVLFFPEMLRYYDRSYSQYDVDFYRMLALLLYGVWCNIFLFAFFLSSKIKVSSINFELSSSSYFFLSFFVLLLCFYSMVTLLSINGGVVGMMANASRRIEANTGVYYLSLFLGLGMVGTLILLAQGYKRLSFVLMMLIFSFFVLLGSRGGGCV